MRLEFPTSLKSTRIDDYYQRFTLTCLISSINWPSQFFYHGGQVLLSVKTFTKTTLLKYGFIWLYISLSYTLPQIDRITISYGSMLLICSFPCQFCHSLTSAYFFAMGKTWKWFIEVMMYEKSYNINIFIFEKLSWNITFRVILMYDGKMYIQNWELDYLVMTYHF